MADANVDVEPNNEGHQEQAPIVPNKDDTPKVKTQKECIGLFGRG